MKIASTNSTGATVQKIYATRTGGRKTALVIDGYQADHLLEVLQVILENQSTPAHRFAYRRLGR